MPQMETGSLNVSQPAQARRKRGKAMHSIAGNAAQSLDFGRLPARR